MSDLFSMEKLKKVDTVFLYYILMAFFLVNASWIFQDYAAQFKDMIFVYSLTFLMFTKPIRNIGGGSFLENLPKNLIYTMAILFVVSLLPIQQLGLYDVGVIYPNVIIAFLWVVCIAAYTETVIFAVTLPDRIGVIPASLVFALFHIQTLQVLNISLEQVEVMILFFKLFFMNVFFCYVYKYTKSIYLTALVHGSINLAKIGVLAIIIWRLFV